jgi:cellulose synthase/poly-beta-1,6-N-acetylglucosamine synthase-like glycosyltransferase
MTENKIIIDVTMFPGKAQPSKEQEAWGMHFGVIVDLSAARLIDRKSAQDFQAIPLAIQGKVLTAAFVDPNDQKAIASISQLTGYRIRPVQTDPKILQETIDKVYSDIPDAEHLQSEPESIEKNQPDDEPPAQQCKIEVTLFPGKGQPFQKQKAWGIRSEVVVDFSAARLIDRKSAEAWQALPLAIQGKVLTVALVDPNNQKIISSIMQETGLRIRPVQVNPFILQEAINKVYLGTPDSERLQIGQLLLQKHLIDNKQLDEALQSQQRTGERLGKILISMGFINRLVLAEILAEQYHLSLINLRTQKLNPSVVRLLDEGTARSKQCLPVKWIGNRLLVAMVDPSQEAVKAELQRKLNYPLIFAVTSEFDIDWALDHVYRATYLENSIAGLLYRNPEDSAFQTFTNIQLIAAILFILLILVAAFIAPIKFFILLNAIAGVFYLATTIYRLWLAARSNSEALTIKVSEEEIAALDDNDLPIYTVMIPVFHEKEVLAQLIQSIESLNYPKEKLDVKLLFEESDSETIQAAKEVHPPGYIEFIIVPDAIPRTKPKALNYGLVAARGTYTVIYDAEDSPDPDQLKQAVLAFRRSSSDVICLQARLNYYNSHQNLLTRLFTIEYSMWFDLVLPGLDSTNVPIPLGGTSNHFITEKLRELGAWDPFNVTEDADLGIRLYKRKYRTAIIDSTTYEEANSDLWNWVRQRSRWEKGYMQTWLVSMRHPVQFYKSLGLKAFLSFQITIGGSPFILIINPVYWLITTIWFLGKWSVIQNFFPGVVFYMSLFNMFTGNFFFIYLNLLATYRRKYYDLSKYALLSPIYWFFMSVAAWRAMGQLITQPFYWEKTVHGLHIDQKSRSIFTKKEK